MYFSGFLLFYILIRCTTCVFYLKTIVCQFLPLFPSVCVWVRLSGVRKHDSGIRYLSDKMMTIQYGKTCVGTFGFCQNLIPSFCMVVIRKLQWVIILAGLLGLWFRIRPGKCDCCVLCNLRPFCDGPIPRLGESYRACECVTERDQTQQ
jgi:hypothetical protein